ncbi:hypothetical protein [Streptomyces sp. AS02]|uniref:hypothetical protein n=1 Tax=Streptomyces sp. AS02 TaxID=2938946 RepID=UPI00201FFA6F|nr:hypothetical protein [Streptomyces sp. AS02]MCL8013390.1 hypothetical protein [Streptomyces sp. AS02]
MLSPDRIRELMRELDDPAHLEYPEGYDWSAARQRFERLAGALERRFGPSVTSGGVPDASLYGFVLVPAEATGTDRRLSVLMSNFGPFVTAGTGKEGGWGLPRGEAGLSDEFVAWLDELCTELGCVYVPAELVLEPYDGPTLQEDEEAEAVLAALAAESGDEEEDEEDDLPPSWYDRYFQFM